MRPLVRQVLAAAMISGSCSSISHADTTSTRTTVLGRSASAQPRVSTWNGSVWSASATATTVTNVPQWAMARDCPKRDEQAYATQDSSRDVYIWFRISGSYGAATRVTINTTVAASRVFAIAYEQLSGDLLAVFDDQALGAPPYRTATNGSLSAQSTISGIGGTSALRIIGLYPKGSSNEIALLSVDGASTIWANVWSGSAWGTSTQLSTTAASVSTECFSAVYLSSGAALVAYANSATNAPIMRTYSAGTWSGATTLNAGVTVPKFIKLAVKPGTSTVVLAALGTDQSIIIYTYNGTTWTGPTTMATTTGTSTARDFDVCWTADGTKALLAYSKNAATPFYRTFDGTTWSAEVTGPSLAAGSAIRVVALTPERTGSDVFMLCAQANLQLWSLRYTGGTLGSAAAMETSMGGAAGYEPFWMTDGPISTGKKVLTWTQVQPP